MATPSYRAWNYTSPLHPPFSALALTPQPAPPPPSPGTIHIRAHAAALNPVDIQLSTFPLLRIPLPFYPFTAPRIPAHDFAGVVIATGSPEAGAKQTHGFEVGDEVCGVMVDIRGYGALAEVLVVEVGDGGGKGGGGGGGAGALATSVAIKKPSALSWVQAAGLPTVWLTARTCVAKCEPFMNNGGVVEGSSNSSSTTTTTTTNNNNNNNNNRVVVLGGSSATGIYSVQLARQRGWEVLATCSGRNVEFVRGLGASEVVDYTAQSVADEVRRFKPAAIIDCVGGTECLGLAERYYVTIVGDKTGRSTMGGSLLYLSRPRMVLRWALGKVGWGLPYDCIVFDQRRDWLEEINGLKAGDGGEGQVVVDSVFGFEQARDAYESLNTGRARGKVVVTIH